MSQLEELPPNGAGRWMRLDLHLHTPASEDYAETNVNYLEILREAERRHLDIIAFTDHNTVHGYELFRNEVEFLGRMVQANRCTDEEREHYAEFQRILDKITILPGFEFTSHYGAHILGVFAPTTPLSVLEAVLLQLGVPTQDIKSGSCSIANTKYVTEAYEIIARNGGIVIAPHVNAPSGVVTETLRMGSSGQSRVAATQSPHLHALEFVNFYTTHDTFLTPHFYNGQHEHYERAMFCIQGSDAHRVRRIGNGASDPRRAHGIGDRYFEAFLAEPSFEALKALLATTAFERVRVPKRDQKQWEIDNLRFNGESRHFILRPATGEYLDQAWQDMAALANADGGVLIIGAVDDDQERLAPAEISERLRTQIATMIDPKPALSMELMNYEGRELVRIEVKPTELPPYITSNGAMYVRRDDATVPATRDEILQIARHALASGATTPLDNGEELDLPRSGVEIVGEQKRVGVWSYEVRDLRTTTGVERDRAQGLWAYAIARHEELRDHKIDFASQVRWHGRLGVWRTFQQGNRNKYDLLHRDANGVIDHIFYGVSEWGLGEGWRTLLGLAEQGEESHDEFPSISNDTAPLLIAAPPTEKPPLAEEAWRPWGDRKYRWKGRGGLWRIYGADDKLRFDLSMRNKDDEEFQEFRDVTRTKLSEAWINLIRVQPPTTGIEVVSVDESEWGRSFRFRNLRTGEISDPWRDVDLEPGTVREYAARMYLEDMPIDEATVRWWGNIGYMRPMRSQVDLVYRDQDGADHIYYAARREELENEWRELLETWPDE
jgi:hypothetical protein